MKQKTKNNEKDKVGTRQETDKFRTTHQLISDLLIHLLMSDK